MARNGILCGGSICIDVNKVIDRLPPPEHVATIVAETPDSGGPGFNMAVNLARLGAGFPLGLSGVVGDDDFGRLTQEICRRHGIDTAWPVDAGRAADRLHRRDDRAGHRPADLLLSARRERAAGAEPLRARRHAGQDLPLRCARRARAHGSADRARQRLLRGAGRSQGAGACRPTWSWSASHPSGSTR